MGLKATRKLLSIILAVITALSTIVMISSFVLDSTFATKGYLTKHLVTDELVAECQSQLDMKYAVLEVKSGIPARVFKMVESDYSTSESLNLAVQNLFTDESETLYSEDKVNYFYNLCIEYLDGNDVSYKKADVERTAEEATQIYSECVGIHNADTIESYLSTFSQRCAKIGSASLLVIVIALILLVFMYNTREYAYLFAIGGACGGSIATALGSIICIIAKVGSNFSFEPAVYQQSFYSMTRLYFVILLGVSLALTIALYALAIFFITKNKRAEERKNSRFDKMLGKF
jgi:hypothetical protein